MQSYDAQTVAALQSGALIIRDLVTVRGKTFAGAAKVFCYWIGEDDVAVTVQSALTGAVESRNYIGGGTLLKVDAIPWALGLGVRTISIKLSQIHSSVQDMARGNNVRHAVIEVHRALFSAATGLIVGMPYPRFLGKVDGAPIETPAAGSEGFITLSCVSNTQELTRTNTAMKSDAQQQLRSSDRFRRYSDTAGDIEVDWGVAKDQSKRKKS